MSDRRPLTAGVKPAHPPVDPAVEKQFVFAGTVRREAEPVAPPVGRSPLTTRVRADFAAAIKRASLERQLAGTTPHTLQEILEEAIEPWLKQHGYIA